MGLITLLLLAGALGTDAFSLSLGIGLTGVTPRQMAIISLSILLFHIVMPLLGWQTGLVTGNLIGRTASIAGSVILLSLGVRMIWKALPGNSREAPTILLVKSWGLLLLCSSVSMDALAVGFTLGTQKANLILTVITFGFVAGLMTLAGLSLGRWLGYYIGEKAQLVGGAILIAIGIKLVV